MNRRFFLALSAAAAVLAFPIEPTPALAADSTPFASLAGSWSGAGQVRLEGGKYESIRCKAYYTVNSGGAGLGMAIRCASSAAKVEMRANLTYANGKITGDWEERTYNAVGNVSGTSAGSHMSLTIEGGGLNGSLAVRLSDKSQLVSISTTGSAFRGLNLSLTRG